MIKKITLIGFFFTALFSLNAQTKSMDIDNFTCKIRYRGVPERLSKPVIPNYFCMFKCSPWMQSEIGTSRVMDAMEIAGLEKVYMPAEADIYYQIDMQDLKIIRSRISERKSEHKDKHGNVTVRFYYRAEADYSCGVTCSVIRPDDYSINGNDILYRVTVISAEPEFYSSSEFNSRRSAEEFWDRNRASIMRQIIMDRVTSAVAISNAKTSKIFGFPVISTTFSLIITDEDKHYENAQFRAATIALKARLEEMTPDNGLDWSSVEREVEYFNSVIEKYSDPKHKADIRIRHAALHNLFAIYYFLDDVENATKYARLLLQNGFEKGKAEADLRLVAVMESDFGRTGIKTRHFSTYDLYSLEGHGNNSRYDPRGQVGTYLNNGYYDGYGQGWHNGYRDRYRNSHGHGGHGDGHGDSGHSDGRGGSNNNSNSSYGPRNNAGNGTQDNNSGSTTRPTQSSTTAPASTTRPTQSSTTAPASATRPTQSTTTAPASTTRPTQSSTTAPASATRPTQSTTPEQKTTTPASTTRPTQSKTTQSKTTQSKTTQSKTTEQETTQPSKSRPTQSK
ncbi:MAG: hypothetical protein LBQ31_11885 [Bacteroidales bacterium]|jgi:hypothetical protein|nr:hypothetical protein [Bacteroidales bacterium]